MDASSQWAHNIIIGLSLPHGIEYSILIITQEYRYLHT